MNTCTSEPLPKFNVHNENRIESLNEEISHCSNDNDLNKLYSVNKTTSQNKGCPYDFESAITYNTI